jgi:hypothetical protein
MVVPQPETVVPQPEMVVPQPETVVPKPETVVPQPGPSEPSSPEGATESPEDPPGLATYNTGDSEVWPSIDMPLVITVEVPEVPQRIQGPSPPIPDEEP